MSLAPKEPGDLVGDKYRIVRELGSGAMGRVFEAVHVGLDRRFALKFLRTSRVVETLEREARAAGSIENEHIAAVTDFGIDGTPYLVMEYLEGEDLAALLDRYEVLPVTRAVDLVLQACSGLRAAHARGIVHRDLKPANLFVTRRADGTDLVKVLDFGVATQVIATDHVMGTPRYMAPEQARGDATIDERVDVYALGVVLFECLSGAWPHDGASTEELITHLLQRPPISLADLRTDLPPALTRAVDRAVATKRERRFDDVHSFAAALAAFAPAPDDDAPAGVPSSRPRIPRRALTIGGGIAVAALAIALYPRSPVPAPAPPASAPSAPAPVTVTPPQPAVSTPATPAAASTPPAPPPVPRPIKTAPPPPSSRFDRTNPY